LSGRGKNYSINEIADMFGKDYPRINLPSQPGEYDRTLADYSLAQDVLGWEPTVDIKDYIKEWLNESN
jgi:nucleoside-diphosphate-sugar epimerase